MTATAETGAGPTPGRGRAADVRRRRWQLTAVAIGLLAFLAATNRYVSTAYDLHQLHDSDSLSYRAMANAAPGLLGHRIPEWHAERFAVQWVLGSLAKLLHVGLTPAYFAATVLVTLAICLVLVDLVERVGVSLRAGSICLALFVLNPYTLRSNLIGPVGVGDLVLILGMTIAARGLVLRSPAGVLAGLLLGTLARQTAVPPALVAAVAIAVDPLWGARLGRRRAPFALAVLVLPVACYAILRVVAHPFSGPSPSLDVLTLLGTPANLHLVAEHFGRSVFPLLATASVLVASGWILRRTWRAAARDGPLDLAAFWATLAFGLSIVAEAMVLNPVWVAYNEPRLTSLAIAPLIAPVALALRALEAVRRAPLPCNVTMAALALLAIGSFHHIYTWFRLANVGETVVLQVGVAVALAAGMIAWAAPHRAS